jgi:hypothetical protein
MNQPQLAAVAAATQTREAPQPASDFDRLLQQTFSPREILEGATLDKMYQVADSLANSRISVPEHLRGNVGDCLAIVTQAMLWNMNPFAVAQKTHIVSGRLGYEAQLVNAVLQNSGAVRGLPVYEYRGDGAALECRVGFAPRGGGEVVFGEWLRSSDVTTKNSPLWKTNPKQQLGYLQIKNWARAFVPGAILGVYSVDELEDMAPSGPRVQSMGVTSAAPAPTAEASPPPAALPAYPDESLEKNLGDWNKLIQSGRKSADQIVASLMTKASLTDAQAQRIYDLAKPPASAGSDEPPADGQA